MFSDVKLLTPMAECSTSVQYYIRSIDLIRLELRLQANLKLLQTPAQGGAQKPVKPLFRPDPQLGNFDLGLKSSQKPRCRR